MQLSWTIEKPSLEKWRKFINENIDNDFVHERKARNITRTNVDLSKSEIWRVLIGCQVTTQQRSGPNSPVSRFLDSSSIALDYKKCKNHSNIDLLLQQELSKAGLRRSTIISSNLRKSLTYLENGGWQELVEKLETLQKNTTKGKERKVAMYLSGKEFPGLGPKQSRNFIQWLGLSRYEIPIDSRITKTMKKLGCSFVPSASALSDKEIYLVVQDGLQEIAAQLDIYPCILDACVFSSFDK